MDTKRVLDIVVGSLALALAAPILACVALAMRVSGDRGPFLYRAQRMGEGLSTITILKIRTMAVGSMGPKLTAVRDPRVTPLGRILRRYRIDELPQLVNVLRGEMSLVGPRPEDPAFVDLTDPLHRRVFSARPGLTGPAQLEFCAEAELLAGTDAEARYREVVLPAKMRLDAAYLDSRTMRLDLEILCRTVARVLRSQSADHGLAG